MSLCCQSDVWYNKYVYAWILGLYNILNNCFQRYNKCGNDNLCITIVIFTKKTVTLTFVWSYRTNLLSHTWRTRCASLLNYSSSLWSHIFPSFLYCTQPYRDFDDTFIDIWMQVAKLLHVSPTHNRTCRKSQTGAALVIIVPPYGASVHGLVSMGSVRVVSELWKPFNTSVKSSALSR